VLTGDVFWHRLFLQNVKLVIVVDMRLTHNGNAALFDEILHKNTISI